MAEDPNPDNEAESHGRMPPVPKPPREPVTIEGEATERADAEADGAKEPLTADSGEPIVVTSEAAKSPDSASSEADPIEFERAAAFAAEPPPPAPPPSAPPRTGYAFGWGLGGALIGGLIGAGIAVGGFWVYGPWEGPISDVSARQSTLEATSSAQAAAEKSLETRVAALETAQAGAAKAAALTAVDARLTKLEGTAVKPDALAATAMDAKAAHDAANKALALAVATAAVPTNPPGAPAPDPRVTRLVADSAVQADRIARIEATLETPKSETRAPSTEPPPKDDNAAKAIAAIALEQRLRSGEPYAAEYGALSRLGADPKQLAVLKPYADTGVPTAAALGASFTKFVPAVLEAANPETEGGDAVDKLLGHMTKLVRVHPVGEVVGEDPDALVSQVAGALGRGQVADALKIYARLPEPAQKAGGDWPAKAEARASADAAARALRDGAISGLAAAKN